MNPTVTSTWPCFLRRRDNFKLRLSFYSCTREGGKSENGMSPHLIHATKTMPTHRRNGVAKHDGLKCDLMQNQLQSMGVWVWVCLCICGGVLVSHA